MLRITNTDIYLTRGDSALLELKITDEDGHTWEPTSTDKVIFCLKRSPENPEPLLTIQAAEGQTDILLYPNDTKELSFGEYIYDIHVETTSGNIFTVIADSKFEIGKEAHTSWS